MIAAFGLSFAVREVAAAPPTKDECVDAFTRAQEERRDGKLLESRRDLLLCANQACPKLVRTDCTKGFDELTPLVPTIVFQIKDGAGQDRNDASVTLDNQPLSSVTGSALEVNPGSHTFVFRAPNAEPVTLHLVILEADRGRRETVTIGAVPPPSVVAPITPPPLPPPSDASPKSSESGLGAQRIGALVAGGVGVIGVGLGTYFGVHAMSQRDDAKAVCPNDCATEEDAKKWSDAKASGNISTVAFIVGGAALAGGVLLWVTAKPPSQESGAATGDLRLGVGLGSLQMRGTW
ncbi:MAG TPA: hypothetical protein VGC79_34185 [Polyangiaceae bacterium]